MARQAKKIEAPVDFATLIREAIENPGRMASCYRNFHRYSFGNQMLAYWQCLARDIEPGPMATYKHWQSLGRHVRRGEKAITLCQPVTIKRDKADPDSDCFTLFTYRNRWFVLSQTDGEDYSEPAPVGGWDRERALKSLGIEQVRFTMTNGNCQGYATGRKIAVNPLAEHAERTVWHELAHVVLGHTSDGQTVVDGKTLSRSLAEVEAETVSYILGAVCMGEDDKGAAESRGYIQNWFDGGNGIPEKHAQRIIRAAQKIIEAGMGAAEKAPEPAPKSAKGQTTEPADRSITAGEMAVWRKALK